MLKQLADELSVTSEAVLETVWQWQSENDDMIKERLWQQLIMLNEAQQVCYVKLIDYMAIQREHARALSKATLAKLVASCKPFGREETL